MEWTTQKQISSSKRKDAVILSSFDQCIDTLILFPYIFYKYFPTFIGKVPILIETVVTGILRDSSFVPRK